MSSLWEKKYMVEAKMMTLDEVREQLLDRRIDMVADSTGLHYSTVQEIRSGKSDNPSYKTVKALSDYLEGKTNAI